MEAVFQYHPRHWSNRTQAQSKLYRNVGGTPWVGNHSRRSNLYTAVRVAESPVTAPVSDSPATIDDLLLDDPHGEEAIAAQSLNKQPFCWEKQWYAVAVASDMDATRPSPIQLLGKNLVVWMDGTGQWQCFEDRCPHRAAPLSEGKIWSDGTLMCSYHGWRFDDQGNCIRIPQASSPEAEQRACASSRACATKYPIAHAQGMLFVWGEGGKDAEIESSKAPLPLCEHLKAAEERGDKVMWMLRPYAREIPYDFSTQVENLIDPAHTPFSHHGYLGNREKVKYGQFEMKAVPDPNSLMVELKSDLGTSSLAFMPPTRVNYLRSPEENQYTSFIIYCTPTSPGRSKFLALMTTNVTKLPWFMRLTFSIPLWMDHIFLRNTILDGDNVFLHFQEHHLAETARAMENDTHQSRNSNKNAVAWRKQYFMPTRADTLVAAFKNWLDVAGKGGPHGPLHRRADHQLIADHHVLLDRYEQHTKNCPACRSALSWVERLRALSAVLAVIGLGAAVSAAIQATPLKSVVLCGVLGVVGGLAWHFLSLLRAQFYFVDYDHATR